MSQVNCVLLRCATAHILCLLGDGLDNARNCPAKTAFLVRPLLVSDFPAGMTTRSIPLKNRCPPRPVPKNLIFGTAPCDCHWGAATLAPQTPALYGRLKLKKLENVVSAFQRGGRPGRRSFFQVNLKGSGLIFIYPHQARPIRVQERRGLGGGKRLLLDTFRPHFLCGTQGKNPKAGFWIFPLRGAPPSWRLRPFS